MNRTVDVADADTRTPLVFTVPGHLTLETAGDLATPDDSDGLSSGQRSFKFQGLHLNLQTGDLSGHDLKVLRENEGIRDAAVAIVHRIVAGVEARGLPRLRSALSVVAATVLGVATTERIEGVPGDDPTTSTTAATTTGRVPRVLGFDLGSCNRVRENLRGLVVGANRVVVGLRLRRVHLRLHEFSYNTEPQKNAQEKV